MRCFNAIYFVKKNPFIKLNEVEKAPRHSAKRHYAEKHKSRHLGEWLFNVILSF